jgi:hypothetical protein
MDVCINGRPVTLCELKSLDPGNAGSELLQRWMGSVNEVSLALAHEPTRRVDASLSRLHKNLNDEFRRVFPNAAPATISAGCDSIIVHIEERRREIESNRWQSSFLDRLSMAKRGKLNRGF